MIASNSADLRTPAKLSIFIGVSVLDESSGRSIDASNAVLNDTIGFAPEVDFPLDSQRRQKGKLVR